MKWLWCRSKVCAFQYFLLVGFIMFGSIHGIWWFDRQARPLLVHCHDFKLAKPCSDACTSIGAFGGILAFGIRHSKSHAYLSYFRLTHVIVAGVGGKNGWAWIFILEGLFTLLCALPAVNYLYSSSDRYSQHDSSGLFKTFLMKVIYWLKENAIIGFVDCPLPKEWRTHHCLLLPNKFGGESSIGRRIHTLYYI